MKELTRLGRPVEKYEWSGFVLATLLTYLEESRGIALMKSELDSLAEELSRKRGATCVFLTHEHQKWIPQLEPATYSEQDLCKYYNEFNETNEPDAGHPMLDGIRFLQQAITALGVGDVGLLSIG